MMLGHGREIYRDDTRVLRSRSARHTFFGPASSPFIGNDFSGGSRVPHQLPTVGTVVVIKLAGHADDRRFILTDVLPAVEHTERNNDEALISSSQEELIDAAESARSVPPVIADNA